jgi:hypothetical protein
MLKELRETVLRKIPEIWLNDWFLHSDNATAHEALSVKPFLTQKSITELEHTPCSHNLAPSDFRLFPKMKSSLKERIFEDIKRHPRNMTTVLKAISQ